MMAKKSCRKRPCAICRKWFLPDVRQKGRQRTCGPVCRKERHRRQCEAWNRKNKAQSQNNYLGKKLEKIADQKVANDKVAPNSYKKHLPRQTKPVLPIDIIVTKYGIKSAIMVQYVAAQILNQTRVRPSGSP